jgi:hypothetical protein
LVQWCHSGIGYSSARMIHGRTGRASD